jgi:hypothetical protein
MATIRQLALISFVGEWIWRGSTFGVVTEVGLKSVLSQVSESGPRSPSFGGRSGCGHPPVTLIDPSEAKGFEELHLTICSRFPSNARMQLALGRRCNGGGDCRRRSGPNDLLLLPCRYALTRKSETTWLVNAVFTLQIARGTFAGAGQAVSACKV